MNIDHVTELFGYGDESGQVYLAEVFPELFPDTRRMRLENWSEEDREVWCGGEHAKAAHREARSA